MKQPNIDIIEILKGARNYLFPNEKIKDKATRRLSICSTCPNLIEGVISTCGVCGCVLKLKAMSDSLCPLGKWD